MPLVVDAGYPATGSQNPSLDPFERCDQTTDTYYPVETPQGNVRDTQGYGGVVGRDIEHHEVDASARAFGAYDTGASLQAPLYVSDPGVPIDHEIGGMAGMVNTNPYTMGPVVPFEDFAIDGAMAKIQRLQSDGREGPVKGTSTGQGSAMDAYAHQLEQSQSVAPSQDRIALSLLGATGRRNAQYDGGFPA